MSKSEQTSTVDEPLVETLRRQKARADVPRKRQPRYNVVLWDDNEHSYDYVMKMMQVLFAHPVEKAFQIAETVDARGRAICLTTTLEHAELKRDQIHSYGKDSLIARCAGSMSASIEPVPE